MATAKHERKIKAIETCLDKVSDEPMTDIVNAYRAHEQSLTNNTTRSTKLFSELHKHGKYNIAYYWVFGWSKECSLTAPFHWTLVISYNVNGRLDNFIVISHVMKGFDLISLWPRNGAFPYKMNYETTFATGHPWFFYDLQVCGGIACQGTPNRAITVEQVAERALRWWYSVDVWAKTSSFPGSCSGIVETLTSWIDPGAYTTCSGLAQKSPRKVPMYNLLPRFPIVWQSSEHPNIVAEVEFDKNNIESLPKRSKAIEDDMVI